MSDKLFLAASRFEVPTEADAGPGGMPDVQIWSRWPRHRLEVGHELLGRVLALHPEADFRAHGAGRWRASVGNWSHVGTFEDAVAFLALHLSPSAYRQQRQRDTDELHRH